jgi:glycerophosphoryl diester phosphodiesterase
MNLRSGDSRDRPEIPLILGHRGAAKERPENTLAAFRRAIEVGADGVEFDVQRTQDGELVVIHDERLDRTTNSTGWVKDHTLAALRKLDAGRWFGPAYRGERIPLLREVLDLVGPAARVINVELKNSRVPYPGMEAQVVEALRHSGVFDRTVVSSFNHESLRRVKALDPTIRTGVLYVIPWRSPIAKAVRLGADAIHPSRLAVSRPLVRRAHQAGLRVCAWTVNRPEDFRRTAACGVDAIITDHPLAMRALRASP